MLPRLLRTCVRPSLTTGGCRAATGVAAGVLVRGGTAARQQTGSRPTLLLAAAAAAACAASASASLAMVATHMAPVEQDVPLASSSVPDATCAASLAEEWHNDSDRYSREDVVALLVGLDARFSNDKDILWRLSRAYYKLSEETAKDDSSAAAGALSAQLEANSKDTAVKALASPGGEASFKAHLYYGITLNAWAGRQGTKCQLEHSIEVKSHWEKARALSTPSDPTATNCLGRWCFTFADMGWVTRRVAAVVFASPPTSTYEEALGFFMEAEASDPGFYKNNQMMIGKCHLRLKNKAEARAWLEKAVLLPSPDAEAEADHKEAEKLLGSC